MAAILLTSFWDCGVNVVLFSASLGNIPRQLYEAAAVDGAGPVARFFNVTVPSLRHTTAVITVLSLIGSLKVFALPKIMTNGGPGTSTYTLYLWVFKNGFEYFEMGYACAMAYLLGLIILIIAGARLLLSRREDKA
jgi:ABC-type sugar transport system permease subunit